MTDGTENVEPTEPFPPRFHYLKRIALHSIGLALVFVAAMWWWNLVAQHRLDAVVDAIHARGERVLVEDFVVKPIADDRNAAVTLRSAMRTLALPPAERDFADTFNRELALDDKSRQLLESVATLARPQRDLVRLARFQPEVDWGVKLASPMVSVLLPDLGPQRWLSSLLACVVEHEHLAGHDAEALETARDMLLHSELMQAHGPTLVSHLVASAINERACNAVRGLSYDLQILPQAGATTQPTGPASREQVRLLIAELLDERAYRQGFQRGIQGERAMQYDICAKPNNLAAIGLGPSPPLPAIWRAMFIMDGIRIMDFTTQAAAAAGSGDYPTAAARVPNPNKLWDGQTTFTNLSRIGSRMLAPAFNTINEKHFRGLTSRRVAALRLATRLYQVDHGGEFPRTLQDLVPDYIPALPDDPFAAGSSPFGYRAGSEPFIYSVGADGKDGGGDATVLKQVAKPSTAPAGSPSDRNQWDRADVIFPLLKPVPIQPTTDES